MKQPTIRLNNGVDMPQLGLGVWRSGADTEQAVKSALALGYRRIDTAAVYQNEAAVGAAIAKSGLPRGDIFVTTKLWTDDIRANREQEAFEESLKKLGLDYVDLYLVHWPVRGKVVQSWRAMERILASGKARAVGVSNFHDSQLDELLAASAVVPAVNQVECHPRLTQMALQARCRKEGIAMEAWSPLGGGKGALTENETLRAIGAKYGKTAAQVILRWDIQRGLLTIPKSVNPDRLAENLNVFDFELSEADMDAVFALNHSRRFGIDPDEYRV